MKIQSFRYMSHSLLRNQWAVILCGGRGSRLSPITESVPKPLVKVHDKPILWYTFLTLYKRGFRHFIFPIGPMCQDSCRVN